MILAIRKARVRLQSYYELKRMLKGIRGLCMGTAGTATIDTTAHEYLESYVVPSLDRTRDSTEQFMDYA